MGKFVLIWNPMLLVFLFMTMVRDNHSSFGSEIEFIWFIRPGLIHSLLKVITINSLSRSATSTFHGLVWM